MAFMVSRVGRAFARFGIIPTQLLSNPIRHWGIWLSTGVYGPAGGPGALPAYLLTHHMRSLY
jgi:hypothetical protein